MDLPRFHAVAKMQEAGEPQVSSKARMLEPLKKKLGHHEKLIVKTQERFASKRHEVERKINR